MSDNTNLKVYETRGLINEQSFTGSGAQDFLVVSGSRMLITLMVLAIDSGATVNLYVDNNFNGDDPDDTIETLSANSATRIKRVLSDFHNLFNFRYTVTGGSATFKVGVSLFDNAMTTRIDNAIIEVDLHHTTDVNGRFDSVRIGDGTDLLEINPDGSTNTNVLSSALPLGAATEAKQDAELTAISTLDSNIASELSSLETTLHSDNLSIASKIDTVDSDLNSGFGTLHTDNIAIEGKLDTVNTNLGSIDAKVATEVTLDAFKTANHADFLVVESKQDAANVKLDTIHTDLVTVESKQDTGNASLAAIDSSIDTNLSTRASEATLAAFESANHTDLLDVQTKQDSTNTKLDTIHTDLTNVETKQDTGNASLASIDTDIDVALSTRASETTLSGFKTANHSDLLTVQTKQDSTNTKLDTLHTDLLAVEVKQDTGNASLASIDTKVATEATLSAFKTANHSDLLVVETKQDTGNASLASIDGHLNVNLSTRASESTLAAFQTANHTDLLGVQTRQDSTNTKLDTVHADLVTVEGKQDTALTEAQSFHSDNNARIGATNETAAVSDTSTSGLNGLLKRIAQRLTSIFTGQTDGTQKSRILDTAGNGITSEPYGLNERSLNVTIGDGPQRDAWGRVRVADTDLIESLHFSNGAHPLLINTSLTGSATAAFNSASSSIRLTTTSGATDSAIVQTKRYFRYNPGRSYVVSFSGTFGAKKANVRQRIGYFDANNGLFFQQDASNLAIVVRTDASGSAVDTAVNQSSWNVDKLDGTGASGVTIDPSKHNLYVIDFLWHGAGRIRFGLLYNGFILYCHEVLASNISTNPYMRSPSLPLRVELTNTGVVGSSTTMDIVCFAYQKEASDDIGASYQFSVSTGRTSTTVGATTLPIISIRPKTTFNALTNRIPILPSTISAISSGQSIIVSIVLNATLTGAAFASVDANSAAEFDIASTVVSGGTVIKQFYLAASSSLTTASSASLSSALEALVLGLNIAGSTADIVTVTAQSTAGNTNVFAQIDWQEFQ